jgi:hypothetical protein
VKFCSLFHTFGSSQSNPVCTFPLSSVRLFRFYPRRFWSHVGFYVKIASYYFAGVLRHSFQTIDRRCSHSVANSALGFGCVSPTFNLYHVLRCESFHFLLPTHSPENSLFHFRQLRQHRKRRRWSIRRDRHRIQRLSLSTS